MLNTENSTVDQLLVLNLKVGKHVILAPPGSGKTQLLSQRVVEALRTGVNPQTMLCITFTNRAAKNMIDRVGELGKHSPFIGTLHKFSYQFLLANQIIPASTALLDEEDANQLLMEAADGAKDELRKTHKKIDFFKVANYVREANQVLLCLKPAISQVEDAELYEKIAANFQALKNACRAIDFDDVLHLTLHNLRFKKPIKMCNFNWIQVDEVQDLSHLQWSILLGLQVDNSHVVYFGDYDQSIYSFMGASHESLDKYTNGVTEHYLEDNFRSPPYLIDFFNAFAASNMPTRKILKLKFNAKNMNIGGKVQIHHASGTFFNEAWDIANKIVPLLLLELKNIAILTRTNKDADEISKALKGKQIGHKRVSGFDLFRRRTIKDAMSFLNALSNPQDRMAWTRLLSTFAGIGSLKASREMVNEVFSSGMNPFDWLVNEDMQDNVDIFSRTISSDRFIIFDTETTGLSFDDDIIQIAAAEVINGKPTGKTFEAYLTTNKDISESSKIHNITQEVLNAKAMPPAEAYANFLAFVGDSPIAGHNVILFDLPMLEANLLRANIKWNRPNNVFDTLILARQLYPQMKSYRLAHLIEALSLVGKNTHNAIDDVLATVSLAKHLALEAEIGKMKRIYIKKQYSKFIEIFNKNLAPLWLKYLGAMSSRFNLGDVVCDFFAYSKIAIQYEIKPEEIEHIDSLTLYLKSYTKPNSLDHLLKNLLRDLSSYSEADLITEDVKVVVSTIHKAKGLEFEGVVITSCVWGTFPHFYSHTEEAVREDARLLYVGLTRAKKEILISTHDEVQTRVGWDNRVPSPFLDFLSNFPLVEEFSSD
jgi:DNA helicase-2/ATP-dependent DNA helicase PcrA